MTLTNRQTDKVVVPRLVDSPDFLADKAALKKKQEEKKKQKKNDSEEE